MAFKLKVLYKWVGSIIDKAHGEFINDFESHFGSLDTISNKDRDELRSYAQKLNDNPWTYLFGVALSALIEELPEVKGEEESYQASTEQEKVDQSARNGEEQIETPELDLEKIESTVEEVTFYERVLPAPPDCEAFIIMETQVTQALYRAVTVKSPRRVMGNQVPVEQVSWEAGITFCNVLSEDFGLAPAYKGTDNNCELISGVNGFRLPLEAEWEFAAKNCLSFKPPESGNIGEVA